MANVNARIEWALLIYQRHYERCTNELKTNTFAID